MALALWANQWQKNLIDEGYSLTVFNRSQPAVVELIDHGAESGESPKQIAQQSDVIITMLPDSPDVESVFKGKQGLLSGLTEGRLSSI